MIEFNYCNKISSSVQCIFKKFRLKAHFLQFFVIFPQICDDTYITISKIVLKQPIFFGFKPFFIHQWKLYYKKMENTHAVSYVKKKC